MPSTPRWLAVLIALAGVALIVGGTAMIYWPAGVIVAGVILMAAGLLVFDVKE